jgi:hypothetical protein
MVQLVETEHRDLLALLVHLEQTDLQEPVVHLVLLELPDHLEQAGTIRLFHLWVHSPVKL